MTPTIAERVRGLESDVATLRSTMGKVENHITRANTYFDRAEGAMDAQDSAKKRNWKILIIAAPFVLAAVGGAGKWLSDEFNMLRNVQQIEQQWKAAHPAEFVAPQQMFDDHHQEQAKNDFAY